MVLGKIDKEDNDEPLNNLILFDKQIIQAAYNYIAYNHILN